jgi:3',5'-cyclic AMP phosphodiesterase CpdA
MTSRVSRYLAIPILLSCISCNVSKQEPFSFVQLCDPQLGMGGYQHDTATFKQAVRQINELDCDFVVICGDLVHHAGDSTYADFLRISEGFKMPCHVAPGNHDLGNTPDDTTLRYYRKTIGEDYYSFRNKGVTFIVTNTQLWKADIGGESENHDRWFKESILREGRNGTPVIVIGHYPLYLEDPDEEEEYFNFPVSKRHELLKLFVQNNVRAYLSGHTHRRVINSYENILLVSGETTSKNFDGRPMGFRLWEVSPDTLKQQFVPLTQSKGSKDITEFGQAGASHLTEPAEITGGT